MSEEKPINIADRVMSEIREKQIKMKPRWYFVAGSVAWFLGLFGLTIFSVFLVNLLIFSLRTHGPMGEWRYQLMVDNFPWWSLPLTVISVLVGVWLFRRSDFSYRHNSRSIITVFVLAVILAGWAINYLELDRAWTRGGMMRKIYQQYDGGYDGRGSGWRKEFKINSF